MKMWATIVRYFFCFRFYVFEISILVYESIKIRFFVQIFVKCQEICIFSDVLTFIRCSFIHCHWGDAANL